MRCEADLLTGIVTLEVLEDAPAPLFGRPVCFGIEEVLRGIGACMGHPRRLIRDQEAALRWALGELRLPPGRRICDGLEVIRRNRWRRNRAVADG